MPTKAELQNENDELKEALERARKIIDTALDVEEMDEDDEEEEE